MNKGNLLFEIIIAIIISLLGIGFLISRINKEKKTPHTNPTKSIKPVKYKRVKIKRSTNTFKRENYVSGYLFIALPLIGFALFTAIPLVFSIVMSFSNYNSFTGELTPAGWDNFSQAFTDEIFLAAMQNTGLLLVGLGIQIVVALVVALILTINIKGQTIFRAFYFIPSLCSSVAVTLVWKWLYNGDYGLLNIILTSMGLEPIGWLTDKNVALFSMILQGIWMGIGGGMVMYIAALKNVNKSLYEAAEIDGATSVRKFFSITVPMISPTTFYILVTSIIGTMTDFTRFKIMTNGKPGNATMTTALYIYQLAFSPTYENNFSYASAISWILGIVIIIIIGIVFLTSKKWVHYND